MKYAVHNLAVPAREIDDTGSYAIVDDGPRYNVSPMDKGDGDAVFDSFEEAEEWRTTRRIAP